MPAEQRICTRTFGEVQLRSRDGDSNGKRLMANLRELNLKGGGKGAGDESAKGKDRGESDHRGSCVWGQKITAERTVHRGEKGALKAKPSHFYPDPWETNM